jgi:hypothetical protein
VQTSGVWRCAEGTMRASRWSAVHALTLVRVPPAAATAARSAAGVSEDASLAFSARAARSDQSAGGGRGRSCRRGSQPSGAAVPGAPAGGRGAALRSMVADADRMARGARPSQADPPGVAVAEQVAGRGQAAARSEGAGAAGFGGRRRRGASEAEGGLGWLAAAERDPALTRLRLQQETAVW